MSKDDATYSRVSSRFWAQAHDEEWTDDMVILGLYLLTCEARTTEGLYRLPKGYMAEDLPGEWPMQRLTVSLDALVLNGFVQYDEKARVVFLPSAMKYQRPDNANQQTAAIRKLKSMPETYLWEPFLEAAKTYCGAFHQRLVQAFPKGLAKGLRKATPQAMGDTQLCSSSISTQLNLSARATPVDNLPPVENDTDSEEEQERAGLADQEEPHPNAPPDPEPREPNDSPDDDGTCDGSPCTVREFDAAAVGPLRRAILTSLHPERWDKYGKGGQLDAQLDAYGKHVCAACKSDLGEYERPQREALCRQALVRSVEGLHGSRDVRAVIASRIKERPSLLALIGNRKLEELRRAKRDRRRKGEPARVAGLTDGIPPPTSASAMPETVTATTAKGAA